MLVTVVEKLIVEIGAGLEAGGAVVAPQPDKDAAPAARSSAPIVTT
jgi:hypothetical protein